MTDSACIFLRDLKLNGISISKKAGRHSTVNGNNMDFAKIRSGRGMDNLKISFSRDDGCICYRPRAMVVCSNCGFTSLGRMHYVCERHPQTSFLLDWSHCPNCKGYTLGEH